jgi:hypothetical protein
VIEPGGAAWWLSAGLAVTAAAASLLTFIVPAVLRGTTVKIVTRTRRPDTRGKGPPGR